MQEYLNAVVKPIVAYDKELKDKYARPVDNGLI
jgi:hypothetical protein